MALLINVGLIKKVDLYEALSCKLSLVVIDAHFFEVFVVVELIFALAGIFHELVG